MTPTQRTIARLIDEGTPRSHIAIVEHWNPHANIRQDMFGFADVYAFQAERTFPHLYVQATSITNVASRRAKVQDLEIALDLVRYGSARVEVWGWGTARSTERNKDGSRSKRKVVRLVRSSLTTSGLWTVT